MTKEQIRQKIDELLTTNTVEIRKRIEKVLASSCLSLECWEDDYRLPKILMSAVCEEMAFQWYPLNDQDKEELQNIRHFI